MYILCVDFDTRHFRAHVSTECNGGLSRQLTVIKVNSVLKLSHSYVPDTF